MPIIFLFRLFFSVRGDPACRDCSRLHALPSSSTREGSTAEAFLLSFSRDPPAGHGRAEFLAGAPRSPLGLNAYVYNSMMDIADRVRVSPFSEHGFSLSEVDVKIDVALRERRARSFKAGSAETRTVKSRSAFNVKRQRSNARRLALRAPGGAGATPTGSPSPSGLVPPVAAPHGGVWRQPRLMATRMSAAVLCRPVCEPTIGIN